MTTIQLRAEMEQNMNIIAEDDKLLKRAAKYLRKLVVEKEDETLFTKEEFFRRVDEAKKQAEDGKVTTFTNIDEMNQWLNNL